MPTDIAKLLPYLIGGAVFLVVLYFRWRRMSVARPLKIERMWIRPAIVLAVCALILAQYPPQPSDLVWLALALALGALVGWQRGRFVKIVVHPETHEINQQASPAAMIFLLAIVGLRVILRQEAATAWHVGVNLIADLSIVFAAGLFTVQQAEMWLRARKLLAQARSATLP
jgi:hypothetical protein